MVNDHTHSSITQVEATESERAKHHGNAEGERKGRVGQGPVQPAHRAHLEVRDAREGSRPAARFQNQEDEVTAAVNQGNRKTKYT